MLCRARIKLLCWLRLGSTRWPCSVFRSQTAGGIWNILPTTVSINLRYTESELVCSVVGFNSSSLYIYIYIYSRKLITKWMHTILLTYEEHIKSTFTLTGDHISDLTFTYLINTGFFCFLFLFFSPDFLCGLLVIQALLQVSKGLLSHEISNSTFRLKTIIKWKCKEKWAIFFNGVFLDICLVYSNVSSSGRWKGPDSGQGRDSASCQLLQWLCRSRETK